MKKISAREASRGFSALLDTVYFNSEEIIIERDGQPVAMISPPPPEHNKFEDFQQWLVTRELPEVGPEDDWQAELSDLRALLTVSDPWQE